MGAQLTEGELKWLLRMATGQFRCPSMIRPNDLEHLVAYGFVDRKERGWVYTINQDGLDELARRRQEA